MATRNYCVSSAALERNRRFPTERPAVRLTPASSRDVCPRPRPALHQAKQPHRRVRPLPRQVQRQRRQQRRANQFDHHDQLELNFIQLHINHNHRRVSDMTQPRITIGMATYEDFEGTWATVQSVFLTTIGLAKRRSNRRSRLVASSE